MQGTTEDNGDNRTFEYLVELLFTDQSCGICLQENEGNCMTLNLNDETKYVTGIHTSNKI
jgi:hypothetical protein